MKYPTLTDFAETLCRQDRIGSVRVSLEREIKAMKGFDAASTWSVTVDLRSTTGEQLDNCVGASLAGEEVFAAWIDDRHPGWAVQAVRAVVEGWAGE